VRGPSFDGGLERQDAPPQQDESRPPVHLALQQFQTVDLAFDLAVTPGLLKASDDSRMITSYSCREASEFFDARGGGGLQPSIQIVGRGFEPGRETLARVVQPWQSLDGLS
jgi:hypothetical protein